ncbi:hypothetical protein [Bacillus wiedmannii]|uniref:hypothetical protein n=1 Tax=Bacillus wiedmannii TaxID=1890302 RepID=UPI0015D48EB4|nr:hypothetical protein [Bacillus wiedmannii]
MNANKKVYENSDIMSVSSKPAENRRSYTEAYMENLKVTSKTVLKVLEDINNVYSKKYK